jgi:dolichol-phosphate mannosyltransferase
MSVTLLAPAFNEAPVIEAFVATVLACLEPEWDLLLVDDGSTDGTSAILDRLQTESPQVHVVAHPQNRGLGAALVTGFSAATGDVIVTLDADLSHPLDLIPQLVAGTADADAVYASRFVPGGGMVGVPRSRAVISGAANRVLRRAFRSPVRDLTTGMRAYRRASVSQLPINATGFEAQLEITVRLVTAGARIDEVPLLLTVRAAGESKMRYGSLIPRYGRAVVRLLWLRWGR